MPVDRNRKMIWAEVDSMSISELDYMKLDEAADMFAKKAKEYPGGKIEKWSYPYDGGDFYAILMQREETDKEMAERIAREEERQKQRDEWDRKQYEALKQKFGA